jgi:biopolymer transport protein ExbD
MAVDTSRRGLELEPLNLTPLLDVLFNLIFFFLLATTLKEETPAVRVQVPETGIESTVPQEEDELTITVDAQGNYFLNENPVTSTTLRDRLTEDSMRPEGARRVKLRTDKATEAQYMFDAVEILTKTQHPDFYWETRRRPGGS